MQLIVQFSFLKILAFSLINSVWQMALLWLIILLVFRMFKLAPAQKFNLAFAGQLIGFILFVYTLVHCNTTAILFFKTNISYADKVYQYINISMPYISIVYLLMLIYRFSKLFLSYHTTQRLRKKSLKKMPAANRIFIQQTASLLSLKKKVSIYLSTGIKCPLTIGYFKPVILVPLAAMNHLTKEQMEAVLLHEIAHIKRHDYLLNLIQAFLEKIFFFNIFSRMLQNIMEHERENACDDFVLQFRYNAFHYAEALLKLGRLQTMNALAMAASGKKENVLLLRIKRLIHHDNQNNSYSFKTLGYCFFILIVALQLTIFSSINYKVFTATSTINNTLKIHAINKQEVVMAKPLLKLFSFKSYANILTSRLAIKELHNKEIKKFKPDIIADNKHALNYFIEANNTLDSLKQTAAINVIDKNIILNNDTYRKALSYQNFKQLEAMLQASGKSIIITEDSASKDSYKKLITIEAMDAQGNKNIYKVVVELYQ